MSEQEILELLLREALVEKGATSLERIWDAEMWDALMKTCILFNRSRMGRIIKPSYFSRMHYGIEGVREVLSMKQGTRLVITIEEGSSRPLGKREAFCLNEWPLRIAATFRRNAFELFAGQSIDRANNVLVVDSESEWSIRSGPGAGPGRTADIVIEDVEELLGINKIGRN